VRGDEMGLRREELEISGRAIADERLIGFIQRELSISKKMVKTLREIISRIDNVQKELGKLVEDLERSKEEVLKMQRETLSYISRVTPALYHREDWIRALSKVGNIVDKFSGIAYRLEYLVKRGWAIPLTIRENLLSLSDSVSEILDNLYQSLGLMLTDVEKALKYREKVSETESRADDYFRRSTFSILEANLSFQSMILLLNIAEMLEDVSDTINAVADDLYIVMLDLA